MPKIPALPPMTSPDGADELPIEDVSTGNTKYITLTRLKEWLQALTGWVTGPMMANDSVGINQLDWSNLNISFHAHGTGSRTIANNTTTQFLFQNDSTGDSHDNGNVFNTSTSTFTAPVNGYYLLVTGGLRIDISNANLTQTHINVNGVVHKIGNNQFAGQTVGSGSVFLYMAAGTTAIVTGLQISGTNLTIFDQDAYFSGALIYRV